MYIDDEIESLTHFRIWNHMLLLFVQCMKEIHLILVSCRLNNEHFLPIFFSTNCFLTSGFYNRPKLLSVRILTRDVLFFLALRLSVFMEAFQVWNRFSLYCVYYLITSMYNMMNLWLRLVKCIISMELDKGQSIKNHHKYTYQHEWTDVVFHLGLINMRSLVGRTEKWLNGCSVAHTKRPIKLSSEESTTI